MKKVVLCVLISFTCFKIALNQTRTCRYGSEWNQVVVSSGFGSSSEIRVSVTDYKGKSLSIGPFFDNKLKKIGGISVGHRSNLKKLNFMSFEPYLFYNCIYRKTRIIEERIEADIFVKKGLYTSLEHHFGFGIRQKINGYLNLNVNFGYGYYLGSIMKPSTLSEGVGMSHGTNGTGPMGKIGIDIFFDDQTHDKEFL